MSRLKASAPWVLVGSLGMVWAGRRLVRTHFTYDEWSMIGLVSSRGPFRGAIGSFNGHLYFFQDAIYRLQAKLFGYDSNSLVLVVFAVALLGLHLSIAGFARRVGIPTWTSVLFGGLLTYLGAASETFIFPWQVSPTLAAATAVAAAALALTPDPSLRTAVGVSALMLLSILFDSGIGIFAIPFAGGIVVGLWPRRLWWVPGPSLFVLVGWFLFADLGTSFPGSLTTRIEFAGRLLVRSAGALVGGGAWAGVVVLAALGATTAHAWRSGQLVGVARAVVIAGSIATVLTIASIAQSRANIPDFTFFNFNRYLQNVGLPLALTSLPVVAIAARDIYASAARPALAVLPPLLIVIAFVAGADEERAYADAFLGWNTSVERAVGSAAVIIERGCPEGTGIVADARPAGDVSPQIRMSLVAELVAQGLIGVPDGPPDPAIVATACEPL